MPVQDLRARLQPKVLNQEKDATYPDVFTNDALGPNHPSNILYPLWQTRGVLFPYTPSISTGSTAEYDQTSFIHSNYGYNAYVKSTPKPISISAEFTAQTDTEALYLLAVLHFFRAVTKSYFGVNPYSKAGTPPPVLIFNYLGSYQFNNVPVLVKDFSYTYDATIDYVPVNTSGIGGTGKSVNLPSGSSGGYTWVPTHLTVHVDLDTQYIPIDLRNNFNLDKFRSGKLINKGYI
jgi:hypothetical protein